MVGGPGGQTLWTSHGSTGLREGSIWGHWDGLGSQSLRLREARQLPRRTSLLLNGVRPGAEAAPEERETPILGGEASAAAFLQETVTHMQERKTTKNPRAPPAASTPTWWLTAHLRPLLVPSAPRPHRCLFTLTPGGQSQQLKGTHPRHQRQGNRLRRIRRRSGGHGGLCRPSTKPLP